MTKLLFIINEPGFFLSHRLPIALEAKKAGYEVHVATLYNDRVKDIEALGFTHHPYYLDRRSTNIFKEMKTFRDIARIIRTVKPDLIHAVTIKPVLYSGLITRVLPVKGYVAAISGLGSVFIADDFRSKILRFFIKKTYHLALNHRNICVIFQNSFDRDYLIKLGVVDSDNTVLIKGAGVNLNEYVATPEPTGTVKVLMPSRLLIDKGVREFVAAAKMLHNRGVKAHFIAAGNLDSGNPTSITQAQLSQWQSEAYVDFIGFQSDMVRLLKTVNIVVLPSYREGLPRALMEAAASARAVITTDAPGCSEAVIENKTALLVPVKDDIALANAIETLVDDCKLRHEMALSGRVLAENEFAIEGVVAKHMHIYEALSLKASKVATSSA